LLFIDNIFRFTQAGSEVSALLGRIPSAAGYQPNLAGEMGALQERITSTKDGSITSVQAVYVPADDLSDPAPATTFAHLDATTVLSREISALGIYPAVDPLESTSTMLDPNILGYEHYSVARQVQETLQSYKDLRDIIAILGMEELEEKDRLTVTRARKIQRFLSQPFNVAEPFTGKPGKIVKLKDTIKGFKEILEGKYDHLPEQAFYMVGDIAEVLTKAEEIARETAKEQSKGDDKKDDKKKEDVRVEETKIVYVKDKVQLDQYLRDEGPRNYQKLMDMAKKAEETEFKKATHFQKLKDRMDESQKKLYPSPDEVRAKWKKIHEQMEKEKSDPVGFWKNLLTRTWNKEKEDTEKRMRS